MLVLIFPRFNLDFLAWFALTPLFFLIQSQPLIRATLFGFWTGMVFYFFGLHWVTNTIINYGNLPVALSYLILMLLAAYLSLYLALFCYLVKRLSRGNPVYFLLLAPTAWTSLEYLRSTHAEFGFSWLGLGYSQFQNLAVIQAAEYTGVYGISTLIVFVNAAVYSLAKRWLMPRDSACPGNLSLRMAAIAVLVLTLWLGYGKVALDRWNTRSADEKPLRIALAQGNIEQHRKWNPLFQDQVIETYRKLSLKAAFDKPDLIVWPEAAIPFYYSLDLKNSALVNAIVRETQTPLLIGSPYRRVVDGRGINYNSAFLISANAEILGRYDKIHLVPFGEFVPFQKALWFVSKMVEMIGDFGRGESAAALQFNGSKLGVLICYEITFPDLTRQAVKQGAQFLVNITNDAWFGKSAASYQHMSMAALRAVENRVPIVRAANTGITGTIDPSGKMRQTTELFVEDVVIAEIVPNRSARTYYSRYGDLFSYLCLAMTAVLAVMAYVSRNNREISLSPDD